MTGQSSHNFRRRGGKEEQAIGGSSGRGRERAGNAEKIQKRAEGEKPWRQSSGESHGTTEKLRSFRRKRQNGTEKGWSLQQESSREQMAAPSVAEADVKKRKVEFPPIGEPAEIFEGRRVSCRKIHSSLSGFVPGNAVFVITVSCSMDFIILDTFF